MKKHLTLLLILAFSISLAAHWVEINPNQDENYLSCEQQTRSQSEIQFNLDGFELNEKAVNGVTYTKITHENTGKLLEIGMPDLPIFTKSLIIPNEGNPSIEIISYSVSEYPNIVVYPQEKLQFEHETPQDNFTINSEFYESGTAFPSQIAWTGEPAIMRDLRIIPVTFCPFQYDPQTRILKVYDSIVISINVTGSGGVNAKYTEKQRSRAFEKMYQSNTLNYDQIEFRDDYQMPTILFICNDDDDVLEIIEPLVEWKREKGFIVEVATTSETGTSNTSIKNYIQDAYDNWENPPEYVNLMGDASGTFNIPTWYTSGGYGEGDHPYAQLEGNDVLGDVMMGRMTFSSESTLAVVVNKVLSYEKDPYIGNTNWYSRALLTGDTSSSEYSTVTVNKALKELLLDLPGNFWGDDNFIEVYTSPFPSQMNSAINLGVAFFSYRGYLGTSGWNPGSTNNGYMLPFACIPTCGSNNWASGTGKAEGFYLQGSTTLPGGGIGAVGTATSSTHTAFNNAFALGTWGGFFRDRIYSMGGAVLQGKYYLWQTFPQFPSSYVSDFSYWNTLMGDGSLEIWTRVPQNLSVVYDEEIPTGANYYQVAVMDSIGNPAEGAWVTLKQDGGDFVSTGFCDINGFVILDINDAPDGDYILTVTKHDHIPVSEEIAITQFDQYVDVDEIEYNDATGNNNGSVNPGETVEIILTLSNTGSNSVSNVNAVIESTSDDVMVISDESSFGNIASGETSTATAGFEIEVSPSLQGGQEIKMNLSISDDDDNQWNTWLMLPIQGPSLYASDYHVDGNGLIDPGETENIYFTLTNVGNWQADDIEGILMCNNRRITITDSLGDFGTIQADDTGNNVTNRFTVTASSAILPGTQIPFIIHLTNETGYDSYVTMNIPIGEAGLTDPYGPDEYGYWCYDDGDTDYDKCPEYDWIEIDPSYGGDGNSITWETGPDMGTGGDTGTYSVIDIPDDFTFVFYGEDYEEISICTNGWIAPGYHETGSFMNYHIPGPQGPSPMIAAFWDDLSLSGGNVYWYYDDDLHYMVFQWSRIKNGDTNADETFQIIVYDPVYYPTTTGDCEIKFQYLDVTNNNTGNYPYNHGQYATVGIENEDSRIGLMYTFNNSYPDACKTLQDEMAILFTPPPIPPDGPFINVSNFYAFAGDDDFIESGENALISLVLENLGADTAHNINVEISATDPYITLVDGTGSYPEIPENGFGTLENEFEIQVSENVPDYYTFYLEAIISSDEDSWNWMLPFTAYHPNTFEVNTDSIYYELQPLQTGSQEFSLSNIGDLPVNFYIRTDEITPPGRSVEGSTVTMNTDSFTPGEETTWTFNVYNGSSDSEWLTDVWLDFPLGVTVLDASNISGGSGGQMFWDGVTGPGERINWHGETANEWGVIHNGEIGTWEVDVQLSTEFAGDLTFGWEVGGDGYGDEPHNVTGDITLLYPLRWVNLDVSSGTLEAGESQTITANFDSNDIEPGQYCCEIVITCDSWDTKVVMITLNVEQVDEDDNQTPNAVELYGNYPNPFNPQTSISFHLNQGQKVELKVYNARGQLVNSIIDDYMPAGSHSLTWDGKNSQGITVGSGIYLYTLKTEDQILSRKMIMLK